MSDAPDAPIGQAGGMKGGDPGLEGATETGRSGVGYEETGSKTDDEYSDLQAQEGGNAGAGQAGF